MNSSRSTPSDLKPQISIFSSAVSSALRCWLVALAGFMAVAQTGWGQGFTEGLNNSVTNVAVSGGLYYTGDSGTGDRPASSPFASEGTHSRGVSNSTATITSNAINTIGGTGISLTFRLASFSIGSTGNGADGSDTVLVAVSPDGGTTYYDTLTIAGNNNAQWPYSATGTASTPYDGNVSSVSIAPAGGGARTTDGYSTVTVTNLPAVASMRFRITMLNNSTNERWVADNIVFSGTFSATPTITATGTPGAVNTTYGTASPSPTSFSVSGANMTAGISVDPPANFQVSTTSDFSSNTGTNGSPITVGAAGTIASTTVHVRLLPTAPVTGSPHSGNIALSSSGATLVNVATTASTVTAKALTVTGLSAADKDFDGTTSVAVTGTPAFSGLVNGDSLTPGGSVTWAFADATVGNAKSLVRTGSFTSSSTNYTVTQPILTASIFAVVPSAPAITAITPGDTQLSVAFTPPSSDGGSAITNYKYSTDNGSTFTAVSPSATTSPIVITGLTNGTPYDVQIRAVNAAGDGAASASVSGTPLSLPTLSVTPSSRTGFTYAFNSGPSASQSFNISGTNLTGAPGDLTVTGSSNYEVSSDDSTFGPTATVAYASATLASTPVYVRLKSGLAVGNYNSESVGISGAGATSQNVTMSGSVTSATPPTLTAAVGATVDNSFAITFTENATWRSGITSITVGGTPLPGAAYSTGTAGQITLTPSATTLLQSSGSKSIEVVSTNYTNATVSQTIDPGAATQLALTTQPTAPTTNGGALAAQPVVVLRDQYNNLSTSAAAVLAAPVQGTWTLDGTTSVNAISGTASFSGLTATSAAAVTGATITFSSTGLTPITSSPGFNIPTPEPTNPASGIIFSGVSSNQMTLTWTNGNGANRIVLARATTAVNSPPVDNTTYTANPAFLSGTQIGTGNYVVYSGSGNSVTVTGLSSLTAYHFAVYEFNGSGGTENYLTTTPATGSQTTIAATYTWTATSGSSAWTTAANWTPTRTTPAASDIIQFSNGGSVTVTAVPAQTIAQLLVSGNTTVDLQAGGTNTLAIGGAAGTDLSVAIGSALNSSGASALAISVATGATGSISGNMTYTNAAHTLLAADASGITFNSGVIFTQGLLATGNVFGTSAQTANSVVFASGSTFAQLAGSNPFVRAQPSSVVVFQTGSLFKMQQNTAPSLSGRTYANLEIDNSIFLQTSTGTGALSIDNLTVTNGSFGINLTSNAVTIKGNISVANGQTLSFIPASASSITLGGSTQQNISGTGTLTFGSNANLTVNNASGISLSRDVSVSTLTLTAGTITTGANRVVVASGGTVARTSGYVIGNLQRTFASASSLGFDVGTANGYSPVTVAATAVTGTPAFTVAAIQGKPTFTAAGTNTLARYWTLTGTGLTANLTFTYLAGDVTGTPANYKFFRNNGTTVLNPTGTPTSTSATINGITSFGDWTLGETNSVFYGNWAAGFAGFTDIALGSDPESDGIPNLNEYAFGTNPTLSSTGPLAYANGVLTATGQPIVFIGSIANGVDFRAVLCRRKDYVNAGLTYKVQFSADLNYAAGYYEEVTVTEGNSTFLATDGTIDAVSIPYPLYVQTPRGFEKPAFFRVAVSIN